MQYGCIAEHLKHSFSPEIHKLLADYRYELCEIKPNELEAFLREKNFCGINVTIPYKEAVIPYLFQTDEQSRAIGAVNTVVNRNGKLYGYNTDFYGMKRLIEYLHLDLHAKKVAVLGTGGTSRTACAVAKALGASSVLRVSRTAKSGAIDYEMLKNENTDVQIMINTTPCGMFPNPNSAAVEVSDYPMLEGVVDAVYNPLCSKLVLDAKAHGIPAAGGLFMLVAQAVRASEIFLDTVYSVDTVSCIYQKILSEKENIVLIGMPASGKSTVGRLLAKQLNRRFYDTDELIVKRTGQSIPALFETLGESGFRDMESLVIEEEVSQKNGIVIATGGGAVLRDENVHALKRNGKLYFLDRPLKDLLPTPDRPLASSSEAITRRYEERYHRYCSVADCIVTVKGDAASVANEIGKDFCK